MGQHSQVKIRAKTKRGKCTKIPPSKTTSNSSTLCKMSFRFLGPSQKKGPKRHETTVKIVVSEKKWSLFKRAFAGRRPEEGIWSGYQGDLVSENPSVCASHFFHGFPCWKCSALQKEAFRGPNHHLKGTKAPSYSTYMCGWYLQVLCVIFGFRKIPRKKIVKWSW